MADKKKAGDRAVASSLDVLFAQFGKMGITNVERIEYVEKIPTGILSFDMVTQGGLPRGREVYHFGEEGSGKTTLWMLISRELMRRGMHILWVDAERTFERGYAELLGIDLEAVDSKGKSLFRLIKTATAEQAVDGMIMALELGSFDLIVVDTLAALVPTVEANSSVSKAGMGDASRLYSRATRVWGKALDESGTVLTILNQERLDLGAYGAPKTSPGGKAITKHGPSLSFHSGRNANEYGPDAPTKLVFKYTIRKSKVSTFAMQFSTKLYHELHIRCGAVYEVDYPHELYHAAKGLGLLKSKEGEPWTKNVAFFDGEKLANGDDAVQAFFDIESPLRDRIEQAVHAAMQGGHFGTTVGDFEPVSDDGAGQAGSEEREVEANLDLFGDS